MAWSITQALGFLDLPAVIRVLVYRKVFAFAYFHVTIDRLATTGPGSRQHTIDNTTYRLARGHSASIKLTCKTINIEAKAIEYHHATLQLDRMLFWQDIRNFAPLTYLAGLKVLQLKDCREQRVFVGHLFPSLKRIEIMDSEEGIYIPSLNRLSSSLLDQIYGFRVESVRANLRAAQQDIEIVLVAMRVRHGLGLGGRVPKTSFSGETKAITFRTSDWMIIKEEIVPAEPAKKKGETEE